ncbi:hypothetical protein [Fictibacillus barbaricus]|uniref:Fur-regulated basic protein B n=1 Tax=Fictibacillus barbaricus TaxID=182136 RepID=A0ABU1U5I3_9BACL|nr:hypothetical protein [Fictibacillus barbaricus]MDR7074732.1 hypothetical protein [Fictibacillus barbaricus]
MNDKKKAKIQLEIINDLTSFVEHNKNEIQALNLEGLKLRNKQVIEEAHKVLSKRRSDA